MKNENIINIDSINADNKKRIGDQPLEEAVQVLSEKLELANSLLTSILETTHEFIIFGLDREYRYLSFNNRHKEMAKSQWGSDIAIGMKIINLIDNAEERENMKGYFDRVLSGEQFSSIEEYYDENETVVLGKSHWAPIKNSNSEIIGLVCFIQDVTEKKQFLKELLEEKKSKDSNVESLTFCDQLTGLYNRKFYEKELERLDNTSFYPLSIILVSFNSMDKINNQYGHAVGDIFIKNAVQILKTGCRGDDVVARLEDDKFAILMPRTEGAKVERAIDRMKNRMDEVKVKSVKPAPSFGFATKYEETENMDGIFEIAEKQLERQIERQRKMF